MRKEYSKYSDFALMEEWSSGQIIAGEVLCRRYYDAAFLHAMYYMQDRSKSEDLVQKTFLRIVDKVQKGEEPIENFRNYLLRGIKQNCFEQIRQDRAYREKINGLPQESAMTNAEDGNIDENDKVKHLIGRLPSSQQEPISMWAKGFSYREIATVVDKNENQVRGLIERAKKKLRKLGIYL